VNSFLYTFSRFGNNIIIPKDRLTLLSTSGKLEGGINPSIAKELAPWTADQTITSPPLRALLSITP
jgi:hypothetical protein